MGSDIFISHSPTGAPTAKKLADALRAHGVSSWLDGEHVTAGVEWRSTIRKALDDSRAIVFLIDPTSEPGSRVRDEWSEALEAAWEEPTKRLIPLLIGDAEAPSFLKDRHALRIGRISSAVEHAAQDVIEALRNDAHPLGAVDPAAREQGKAEWRRRLNEIEVAAKHLRRE